MNKSNRSDERTVHEKEPSSYDSTNSLSNRYIVLNSWKSFWNTRPEAEILSDKVVARVNESCCFANTFWKWITLLFVVKMWILGYWYYFILVSFLIFILAFFRCGLTIPVKKKMRNLYHLTTLVIFYLYINSQLLYGFCDYIVNLLSKVHYIFQIYVFCLLTKVEKC